MNELLRHLDLLTWKPVLSSMLLPPVPALILLSAGFALRARRPRAGWTAFICGVLLLWFGCTQVFADWAERALLAPPPPLSLQDIANLRREQAAGRRIAIVALGGGQAAGREYGEPVLAARSALRLHYAIWLSRQVGAPVMFSGGVGYGEVGAVAEARIASTIAERDYGRPLRWVEDASRDTRENAALSLAMLKSAGIEQVVLVTDAWHMPRSLRAFEQAAERYGKLSVLPAPIGQSSSERQTLMRWLPSTDGFTRGHAIWRERIGLWMGA